MYACIYICGIHQALLSLCLLWLDHDVFSLSTILMDVCARFPQTNEPTNQQRIADRHLGDLNRGAHLTRNLPN